ncbi:DUF4878 domain-containing protein [Cohnella luojiensis]|uniref:DUF4878 domain-containing protein n=1 Tax=Cohnella luojiensis TaxID=652876 RepID=A0A4Y8LQN4_9BACL|nr:DUF4878 domain-containing protein [Cohnella luojiensis]TFE23692.1 DUF4878 domain-containing protein [Cohnella luojiensis]
MVSYLSISSMDFPEGEDMDSFIEMLEGEFEGGGMDLRNYEIRDVDVEEDNATVDYEVVYMEDGEKLTEEDSFDLVKVEDKWYIDGGLGF